MQSSLDLVSENGRMTTSQKGEEEQQLEALLFGYKYEKNFKKSWIHPRQMNFLCGYKPKRGYFREALKALRDPSMASSDQEDKPLGKTRRKMKKTKSKFTLLDNPKEPISTVDLTQNQNSCFRNEILQRSSKEDFPAFIACQSGLRENHRRQVVKFPLSIHLKFYQTKSQGVAILPDILSISRLNNANIAQQTKGPIASVRFHPNGNVLLTVERTIR